MFRWLLAAILVGGAAATAPAPKPAQEAAQPPAQSGQALPGQPVKMEGRDAVDPSVPEKWRDEVKDAQWQGALLQQEDFAVWVASNALVKSGLKAPGAVTGWLARPVDALARNWKVAFTAKEGQRQVAYADVDVDLSAPPAKLQFKGHEQGRELSADELALAKARDDIAARKNWLRCSDDYNYSSRFREGRKGREIVVRALPARTDARRYLLGGFQEFSMPAGGGKAKGFQHSNACLELTLPKNGRGFMVTHNTTSTPTLFHVFASLSYQRPVYVKTAQNRMWKVQRGRITVVDRNSLKSLKTQAPSAE